MLRHGNGIVNLAADPLLREMSSHRIALTASDSNGILVPNMERTRVHEGQGELIFTDKLMVFFDTKDVVKYLAFGKETDAEYEAPDEDETEAKETGGE